MSEKRNDDELYELHYDRALSEVDLGVANQAIFPEDDSVFREVREDRKDSKDSPDQAKA